MMIDLSTIANLELVQNLQNSKSKDCLYGCLNETMTRMGARLLKNNLLQPSTDNDKIEQRYAAVQELSTREDMFFAVRECLRTFVDTDRVLAAIVVISTKLDFQHAEQSVNNVLMLKSFVDGIKPIWQALSSALSLDLQRIRELCNPDVYFEVQSLIDYAINPDVGYSLNATDLRNQRVYAIKSGTNGFLDVARQSYFEYTADAKELVETVSEACEIPMEMRFDPARQFYIKIKTSDLERGKKLPDILINVFRKGKNTECQTLDLVKLNQKIKDAHNEVIGMSDASIQELIKIIRTKIEPLFRISEAIAMLDLLTAFAHLAAVQDYVRPELSDTLAIKQGRHPIRERIQRARYIANDVYATDQKRFQIITGCNMSGKSTYIRSIALMTIMAQIGCFIPADYASVPIVRQLFARVATDDCIEANVSTFAAEMREMAFILHNVTPKSLVIVDELGRGTSTNDGLAIALAISEALVQSRAFVWFVTHFRDLPRILVHRVGVVSMHMSVDIDTDFSRMRMRYKVNDGQEEQKFYGLALAQVVDLPHEVMETAVTVSKALHARNAARKSNAKSVALAKKRRLVLQLRETLTQARDSNLDDEALRSRLVKLQDEFAIRFGAIEGELTVDVLDQSEQASRSVEAPSTVWRDDGDQTAHDGDPPDTSSRACSALSLDPSQHEESSRVQIKQELGGRQGSSMRGSNDEGAIVLIDDD